MKLNVNNQTQGTIECPINDLCVEYGSSQRVRFATAVLQDGDGNMILCKCGKPASNFASSKNAYISWCGDCSPNITKQDV